MTMTTRQSERTYPSRRQAAFGVGDGAWLAPAHVVDLSDSGIGLEVRGICHASFGDEIRIADASSCEHRRARVVRLTETSSKRGRTVRLGCRWITARTRTHQPEHQPAHAAGRIAATRV